MNEEIEEVEHDYEQFNYKIIKAISDGITLTACNISIEDQFMGGCWTISNRDNTKSIKKHICSSE